MFNDLKGELAVGSSLNAKKTFNIGKWYDKQWNYSKN